MGCTFLSAQLRLTEANLSEYLRARGLAAPGESAAIEGEGDGNINWVRRVRTDGGRRLVVKQARPALERFPEYQASTDRLVFEARYVAVARPFDSHGVLPEILDFDDAQRVLVLADVGDAPRLDAALADGADVAAPLARLAAFVGAVHAGTRDPSLAVRFSNGEMQRLHGDHVFHLPYRENDFPLPPAVVAEARAVARDAGLVARIDAAYARYLEPRGALVHADVQPGNVLLGATGPVLLDAEIAHVGDPAFDPGSLIAHLLLAHLGHGTDTAPAIEAVWEGYVEGHGAAGCAPFADAARYAGIEMLRRTIGAARVAAVADDAAACAAVTLGRRLVLDAPASPAALAAQRRAV